MLVGSSPSINLCKVFRVLASQDMWQQILSRKHSDKTVALVYDRHVAKAEKSKEFVHSEDCGLRLLGW